MAITAVSLSAETAFPRPKIRLEFLDGMRALAALFVLFNHSFVTIWNNQGNLVPPKDIQRLLGWLWNGHYAVDVFIVLSGFCLMLPVLRSGDELRGGAWTFYKKRARRILPPYYILYGISVLLGLTLLRHKAGGAWDSCIPVTASGVATHLFLLHDLFGKYSGELGYQLWTIPVEWHIYFLFPALVLGWRRFGAFRATTIAVVAAYIANKFLSHTPWSGITIHYVALFAMGALGAGISTSDKEELVRWRDRLPWTISAVIMAGGIASIWHIFPKRALEETDYMDFLVGVTAICALIAAAVQQKGWIHSLLSWKPLTFVGTFSYSLYLVHVLVLALLWQYVLPLCHLSPTASFFLLVFLGAPFIVGLAYLFHLAFERPFMTSSAKAALHFAGGDNTQPRTPIVIKK